MTKSQEMRQKNCFELLRKYGIHDGIVREASDEGKTFITIWRRLTYDLAWHLYHEKCVLGIEAGYTKQGYRTRIQVGIV